MKHNGEYAPSQKGMDTLQRLQDQLAQLIGCSLVLYDETVCQVTQVSRPSTLYKILCDEPVYREQERKRIQALCQRARETHQVQQQSWPVIGVCIACVPIVTTDVLRCYWLLGPVRIDKTMRLPRELLRNAPKLAAGCKSIPLMDAGRLRCACDFLRTSPASIGLIRATMGTKVRVIDKDAPPTADAQVVQMPFDFGEMAVVISRFGDGEILLANQRFSDITNIPLPAILTSRFAQLAELCMEDRQVDGFGPLEEELLDEQGQPRPPVVWQARTADGHVIRATSHAIRWPDGSYVHLVSMMDITEGQQTQRKLESIAYYDALLGLPNRYKLEEDMQRRREAGQHDTYLVCLDIVALRQVNYAHGRTTGDKLLTQVAVWLQRLDMGKLYRCGSDTFVLRLFDECTKRDALALTSRISQRFTQKWSLAVDGKTLELYCRAWQSVVYGQILCEGESREQDIYDMVERSLDIARREKRLVTYDHHEDRAQREANELMLELRSSVSRGMQGFSVAYQPITNPATGHWQALEALCRWRSERVGVVSPEIFIPMAESSGLIHEIGAWVLEQAVMLCKRLQLHEVENFRLSVNLSAVQVVADALVSRITEILKRHDFPCKRLSLEITESSEFRFNEATLTTLEQLRTCGVGLALDDFGTGYATMKHLRDLPVQIIKTEKEFVQDIVTDEHTKIFLHTMAQLAHLSGMLLVVEGVETPEQLELAVQSGADLIQGYVYSPPLTEEDLCNQHLRFWHRD